MFENNELEPELTPKLLIEDGVITLCNPDGEPVFGCNASEILSENIDEIPELKLELLKPHIIDAFLIAKSFVQNTVLLAEAGIDQGSLGSAQVTATARLNVAENDTFPEPIRSSLEVDFWHDRSKNVKK